MSTRPNSSHSFSAPVGTGLNYGGVFPSNRKRQLRIWWREIDRVLLALVVTLMVLGAIAVAAGSPASARRLSTADVQLPDLYFFWTHLRWQALGLVGLIVTSMMPEEFLRRSTVLFGALMVGALILVPIIGTEVNGATRWLNLGVSIQPSEFLKPAYAVMFAWILSWKTRDPSMPVEWIGGGLGVVIVALLMLQPNLGAAVLFAGSGLVMVLLSGMRFKWIGILGGVAVVGMGAAYMFYDNARNRIDDFLGGGTAFDQVDLASRTLMGGGWTGTGVFLGTNKMRLPEAHTDYIFSVVGEEFGLLACAVFIALYLAIVLKVLWRLTGEDRLFTMLAATGLIALFGGQAFINILVNLQLFPSKGMTLPLVSYGGSSTIAQCFTMGLLLAITRRNPYLSREGFELTDEQEKEHSW